MIFEVAGVSEERAAEALRRAGMKFPIKTKVVVRETPGAPAIQEEGAA
jgi:large subunit ribosomal protein L16